MMSPPDPDPGGRAGDAGEGELPTLDLDRLCIDFNSLRSAYEKPFREFAANYPALQLAAQDDPLGEYLERVWPDGIPGTGILANTRPFDHYLLRPPVAGPLADSFAAGSFAPAFSLKEAGRGFTVVGFSVTPHIQPRWFERTISGLFIRSWRAHENRYVESLRSRFAVATDPGMADADLLALRMLPEHRKATKERLQTWGQYLDWKEGLVRRDQVALRYDDWRFHEGKLHFRVRGEPGRRLAGTELMAVALSESTSPDKWAQKGNRGPRGRELGEVTKVEALEEQDNQAPSLRVVIDPDEELLESLESAADATARNELLPAEGFLLSAIIGDLAPLLNQRLGLKRLQDGRSFAPRLSNYLFDITMALPPGPDRPPEELLAADRLNARLNQDQLLAVRNALAAPDFFLIQGPPGTGKTTVIAELCYQVARRGGRVLVASQTNLAVDNALARLGNRPNMRPLRLGEAKRVGDEFKEFLQENVVERWFRGIRAECERRWTEREAVERQIQEASAALLALRRVVENFDDGQGQLRQLQQLRASRQQELAAQKASADTSLQTARTEEALSDALVTVAQWLTEGGARPPAGSLERTRWAQALPKMLARLAKRPPFPDHALAASEGPDGLPGALSALAAMQQSRAALAALETAAERTLAASRGHQGTAPEDSGSRLQALLDKQRRLSESEDESEVQELPQVNREIKRLRGETWSAACRTLADALGKMWGDEPPTALEEVARSLQPSSRHAVALDQLTAWIAAVRSWDAETDAALQSLATDAFSEAELKVALAEKAASQAATARSQVAQLDAQILAIEGQSGEHEAHIDALRLPWSAAWSVLVAILLPGQLEAPWPPAAALVIHQTELLSQWRFARAEAGERHQRWRGIQTEWLPRIRAPSAADRAHLTDLYVAHSNVVGLTCNEAGKRQFHEKEGFRPFDVIIIDEVSKATPPELLLPMLLGAKTILVGDHRQLPPMFRERQGSYQEAIDTGELLRDDFERYKQMVTASLFEELFEKAPEVLKASLWTQYRMHPQVMEAVNYFYSGQLRAGPDAKTLDLLRAHRLTLRDRNQGRLLEPHQHLLWIDSSLDEQGNPNYETQVGSSKVNEWEARTVGRLLFLLDDALRQKGYAPKPPDSAAAGPKDLGGTTRDWLGRLLPRSAPETLDDILAGETVWLNGRVTAGADPVKPEDQLRFDPRKQVGVISFYGKQLGRLKSMRDELHRQLARDDRHSVLDVRMDTVDRFQGMERPIVIVSLVRAVQHLHGGDFVRDFRRINVALSRAQGLLIVVGSSKTFGQALIDLPPAARQPGPRTEAVYRQIFEHAARYGGRREASIVPPVPWENKGQQRPPHGGPRPGPEKGKR